MERSRNNEKNVEEAHERGIKKSGRYSLINGEGIKTQNRGL